MGDAFASRVSCIAVTVAALSTLGAVIYLSVRGLEVNQYLAGLAGLTIGALLPSPLSSPRNAPPAADPGHPRVASTGADLTS